MHIDKTKHWNEGEIKHFCTGYSCLGLSLFPKDNNNNNNKQHYFSVNSNSMDTTKTSWLPPHASNLAIFHLRKSVTSVFSMKPKLWSLSLIPVTLRPYSFSTTKHFHGSSSASIPISSSSPNCGALNSSVSNTVGRNSTLLRLSPSCSTKFGPKQLHQTSRTTGWRLLKFKFEHWCNCAEWKVLAYIHFVGGIT